ncbi:DoxX family protein [Actinosynnema sp. CA-299493]
MNIFDRGRDHAIAVFRIVIGVLFVCHGAQKLFGVLGSKGAVSITDWPSGPAGLIEFVGGVLIIIGLGTRIAALISSGAMAYAYFVVHQPAGLLPIQNKGELAAVYAWVFLLLAFTGPGAWAVDKVLAARKQEQALVNA